MHQKPHKKVINYLFSLRCACGCEAFFILENTYTNDEKALVKKYEKSNPNIRWHSIYGESDSDGNIYNYIKVLGLFKKRIVFPHVPMFMKINVIKCVCSQCQHELILFDSRYHGYDGMTANDEEIKKYTPVFEQHENKSYCVIVAFENEPTLESFNEKINEQCSYEFFPILLLVFRYMQKKRMERRIYCMILKQPD